MSDYILSVISTKDDKTIIQHVKLHNLNNNSNTILGYVINKNVNIEGNCLINLYEHNKIHNTLRLLYTTNVTNQNLKSKIFMKNVNKTIKLNFGFKIKNLIYEPFLTNLNTVNNEQVILGLRQSEDNDKHFNISILEHKHLTNLVYYRKNNLYLIENSIGNEKYNITPFNSNQHINNFLSPVTGILTIYDNNNFLYISNNKQKVNITQLIKFDFNEFTNGISLVGKTRITMLYVPFSGTITKLIKYDNISVIHIENKYFVSDNTMGKWKWNYYQDNALELNRNNYEFEQDNVNRNLKYCIVLFGKFKFVDENFQDQYDKIDTNKPVPVDKLFLTKGTKLLKLYKNSNVCICTNYKLKDIIYNKKIYVDSFDSIGELV